MTEIEVTIQTAFLTYEEPSGRFRLRISLNSNVETLLKQLCKEANKPCKEEYCLKSTELGILCRTDILSEIGLNDGANLTWTSEVNQEKSMSCGCNTFWFMAVVAFLIGAAGLIAICVIKFKQEKQVIDYAVVFDAGSSHTSMFIFKWEGSKFNGTALASQAGESCQAAGGGISSFTSNPSEAGHSLRHCLDEAKSRIPKHKHSTTPVYLGATAGMRLLRLSRATIAEAILQSVINELKNSGFQFLDPKNMARIISGSDEGVFSWISSNYITNSFKVLNYLPDNNKRFPYVIKPTIGALDMGGASTQITFTPLPNTNMPKNYSRKTELFGKDYNVYTHSYLCYGVNEASRRILVSLIKNSTASIIDHPCLPEGYSINKTHSAVFDSPCVSDSSTSNASYQFVGMSEPDKCSNLLSQSLFNFTASCPYAQCSFDGVYQPPTDGIFYAFSSFFYTPSILNLTSPGKDYFTHDSFVVALRSLCLKNWNELKEIPIIPKDFLPFYCEKGNYMNILLTQGYGFTNKSWLDIHFVKKVFDTEVGWTLGFVLDHSAAYPVNTPPTSIYTVTFSLLIVLFAMFILVGVGFVIHAIKTRGTLIIKYQSLGGSYGSI